MFPKTDKIPWICFRERAGTKNTDMTFIHSTRATASPLSCCSGKVIQSKSVHDFKTCSCGACSVDGGLEYLRRVADGEESYAELSITEEITDTK